MVLCCECVAPYLTLLMQSVSVSVMWDEEGCFISNFILNVPEFSVVRSYRVVSCFCKGE